MNKNKNKIKIYYFFSIRIFVKNKNYITLQYLLKKLNFSINIQKLFNNLKFSKYLLLLIFVIKIFKNSK